MARVSDAATQEERPSMLSPACIERGVPQRATTTASRDEEIGAMPWFGGRRGNRAVAWNALIGSQLDAPNSTKSMRRSNALCAEPFKGHLPAAPSRLVATFDG